MTSTDQAQLDPSYVAGSLDVARELIAAGVPVFLARATYSDDGTRDWTGGTGCTGFTIPARWPTNTPDMRVLDDYQPGDALCMVTGRGLDGLDFDPRHGGDETRAGLVRESNMPTILASASTPSGGCHDLVRSLGVGSRDGVGPGFDVKAGTADGAGRGFMFIAPTVRLSKVTGEPARYGWTTRPLLFKMRFTDESGAAVTDESGAAVTAMVRGARGESGDADQGAGEQYDGPAFAEMDAADQEAVTSYVERTISGIQGDLQAAALWPEGHADRLGRGWEKLCADKAHRLAGLALASWNGLTIAAARTAFMASAPTSATWTALELDAKWRSQLRRATPPPCPNLIVEATVIETPDQPETSNNESADQGGTADADGYEPRSLLDFNLAQRITEDRLAGKYCWAAGLGWLRWDGRRWKPITDAAITDVVGRALRRYAADEIRRGADPDRAKKLPGLLAVSKIRAVVSLTRGMVEVESGQFDTHPDLLNVNNGVVALATGELLPHDPALNLTKISPVDYRPGARHPDWDLALTALPGDVAAWMQVRFGQAASGHMAPDDIMPVLRGGGENGKSTIVMAILAALGDHAVKIPDRVLLANPGDHPTEMMTLRGARLALLEELPEGRRLNVKRLKDTVGTSPITARAIAKDNVTWDATHTLMLTTNYQPIIDEVDHGTWRRLADVYHPYKFVDNPSLPTDRPKVHGLRERLKEGADGRREAVLA